MHHKNKTLRIYSKYDITIATMLALKNIRITWKFMVS